jgi:hypothetical protein
MISNTFMELLHSAQEPVASPGSICNAAVATFNVYHSLPSEDEQLLWVSSDNAVRGLRVKDPTDLPFADAAGILLAVVGKECTNTSRYPSKLPSSVQEAIQALSGCA